MIRYSASGCIDSICGQVYICWTLTNGLFSTWLVGSRAPCRCFTSTSFGKALPRAFSKVHNEKWRTESCPCFESQDFRAYGACTSSRFDIYVDTDNSPVRSFSAKHSLLEILVDITNFDWTPSVVQCSKSNKDSTFVICPWKESCAPVPWWCSWRWISELKNWISSECKFLPSPPLTRNRFPLTMKV